MELICISSTIIFLRRTSFCQRQATIAYFTFAQFSPLLILYKVISLTPYFFAIFLMVVCLFLFDKTFLMVFTCDAESFNPEVLLACTFLYANFAGLFC